MRQADHDAGQNTLRPALESISSQLCVQVCQVSAGNWPCYESFYTTEITTPPNQVPTLHQSQSLIICQEPLRLGEGKDDADMPTGPVCFRQPLAPWPGPPDASAFPLLVLSCLDVRTILLSSPGCDKCQRLQASPPPSPLSTGDVPDSAPLLTPGEVLCPAGQWNAWDPTPWRPLVSLRL